MAKEKERPLFNIGPAEDATVKYLLRKVKLPLTGSDFGGKWFVLVDKEAEFCFEELKHEEIFSKENETNIMNAFLESVRDAKDPKKQFQLFSERAESAFRTKLARGEFDDRLTGSLAQKITSTVMHEVAIHEAGELNDAVFISSIGFPEERPSKFSIEMLLSKHMLEDARLWVGKDASVTRIRFGTPKAQEAGALAIYSELKSAGFKPELWMRREEYPILFGLSDIRIIKERALSPEFSEKALGG